MIDGCNRPIPVTNSYCIQHRGNCSTEHCGRPRASESSEKCVLHGGAAIGIALCCVDHCESPAIKGSDMCRIHAPKRLRRNSSDSSMIHDSLMDAHSHNNLNNNELPDFVIDLGDRPIMDYNDQPNSDRTELLSLLRGLQPKLAD
jgi:hypothetical protein